MQSLDEKAEKNSSDMQRLKETLQSHGDQIQSATLRATSMENDNRKFGKRLDAFDRETQSLNLWQQGATEKFEAHAADLERMQSELQQAHKGLDSTNANLDGTKTELASAQEVLTKVSSRLDLLHKYFHGLGKGLQETHRHVAAGDSGMLAPKVGLGTALPMIPGTPRGTTVASPRRQKTYLNDAILSLNDAANAVTSPKSGKPPLAASKPPI